ncbi:MAG: hypothetical protein Q9184_004704 [Pyrenodesmia sp. 2 TL-2023]
MFAFEFAVLTILSLSTTARYGLCLCETAIVSRQVIQGRERMRQRTQDRLSDEDIDVAEVDAAGWEEKGLWIFYLDIATDTLDFFKLVLYLTFFCVLCMFYGMPIHIIRDVALTIRSFYKRIRDFVQYKHATRDMNARYPDATAEEISREDVCIICRENMTVWQDSTAHQGAETIQREHQPLDERQRAKKLPCGHLLHFACLRSWLERQQICPTCRTPVLTNNTASANPGPAVQRDPGAINQPIGGPHVYTFGPFRLVFGARHVNDNPLPEPVHVGTTGPPSSSTLNRNAGILDPGSIGIEAQLEHIEQHIAQEINNYNVLGGQLQVVRALRSELSRLRTARSLQGTGTPTSQHQARQVPYLTLQQTVQAYRQMPLYTGQQDFPAGLTLPENWTLHALQRVPGGNDPAARSWTGLEVPPHQAQPSLPHPQTVRVATGQDSSGEPAQASGAASNSASAELPSPRSSALQQAPSTNGSESMTEPAVESSTADLLDWGSTGAHGTTSAEQMEEEDTRSEGSRTKGKGKAVTVEDITEDVVD